ncbi:unnamed protein product [Echinostoma caproni]|uniref:Transmembrane protein n=1 Tax=Echinostoma caproni TaxID=27848 RepID=A0A183AQT1_9TREM|nr:unnamed protein product [Echinostoma caproni]
MPVGESRMHPQWKAFSPLSLSTLQQLGEDRLKRGSVIPRIFDAIEFAVVQEQPDALMSVIHSEDGSHIVIKLSLIIPIVLLNAAGVLYSERLVHDQKHDGSAANGGKLTGTHK